MDWEEIDDLAWDAFYADLHPCRGCRDFDGEDCTSNGACARKEEDDV